MDDLEFYTPQQIADKLNVNVMTIYRYIKSGELESIKLSRNSVRISRDDFNKFLDKHKTK